MYVFVATSYSSRVNYKTGVVFPEYKKWLEQQLEVLENHGHIVFCALRADQYRINNTDPAEAFTLDIDNIESSDALIAFIDAKVSMGVQTEIGYALALGKTVVIAHPRDVELAWFNQAMIQAGKITALTLPIISDPFIAK